MFDFIQGVCPKIIGINFKTSKGHTNPWSKRLSSTLGDVHKHTSIGIRETYSSGLRYPKHFAPFIGRKVLDIVRRNPNTMLGVCKHPAVRGIYVITYLRARCL
ncbi:hypothetical protein TNCV_1812131 [Trichonephila clavipes]|uniref:Uncharacterized protein n=1 Tax=Trichonephila clavipes TaxID=2585209 RepID=A0A8X6W7A8_TRICX|nr:hypothetical protein TNCV_1812131 [Trichonephila clavipes]